MRRMPSLPAVPIVAVAAVAVALLLAGCGGGDEPYVCEFEAMGTMARVEIHEAGQLGPDVALAVVTAAFDSVSGAMNVWSPDSEISRLNRAPADSEVILSPRLNLCLARATDVGRLSGGAFEPTAGPLMRLWGFHRREGRLPDAAALDSARALLGRFTHDPQRRAVTKLRDGTAFDLGGIAKGYALAVAASALRRLGVRDGLIDLGSNLVCLGGARGRPTWRVGIRDPQDRSRLFASLEVSDAAVATSGSYERFVTIDGRRYGHIMNPATGRPAEGLLSATVITADAVLGDGLSTALFVMGAERAERLLTEEWPERLPPVLAVLVLPPEGGGPACVRASGALEGNLRLRPGYEELYVLEFFRARSHRTQEPHSGDRGGR